MTDPAVIRAGLLAALTSLAQAIEGRVSEYVPDGDLFPPVIWFYPEGIVFDEAGSRGLDEWTWTIHAVVSATPSGQAAQMILDQMLQSSGSLSLKAAVESDATLGGAVGDCRVTDAAGFQIFREIPWGSPSLYLGSSWTVKMAAVGA